MGREKDLKFWRCRKIRKGRRETWRRGISGMVREEHKTGIEGRYEEGRA